MFVFAMNNMIYEQQINYSHRCEDKQEGEIDTHSGVKVGQVEPASHMAYDIGDDCGQVLCEEGAQQISVELETGHNEMMTMCTTESMAKLDTLKTIVQHRVRGCGDYIPGHNAEIRVYEMTVNIIS